MFNVTVIFTRHKEEGNCNSRELLKIIKAIQPEIIFEEIEPSVYDQIYIQQCRTTLESDTVKAYLKTNPVEHIPVDTFDDPDGYHSGLDYLFDVVGKYLNKSERLNRAFHQLVFHGSEGGFPFLNSDQNDVLMEALEKEENHILTEIADDKLHQMAQLRAEVNSKRDDVMIDNMYRYCEQKEFHAGILLIGAGHRRSIKRKLDNIAPRHGVEISWYFLSDWSASK